MSGGQHSTQVEVWSSLHVRTARLHLFFVMAKGKREGEPEERDTVKKTSRKELLRKGAFKVMDKT